MRAGNGKRVRDLVSIFELCVQMLRNSVLKISERSVGAEERRSAVSVSERVWFAELVRGVVRGLVRGTGSGIWLGKLVRGLGSGNWFGDLAREVGSGTWLGDSVRELGSGICLGERVRGVASERRRSVEAECGCRSGGVSERSVGVGAEEYRSGIVEESWARVP